MCALNLVSVKGSYLQLRYHPNYRLLTTNCGAVVTTNKPFVPLQLVSSFLNFGDNELSFLYLETPRGGLFDQMLRSNKCRCIVLYVDIRIRLRSGFFPPLQDRKWRHD